MKKKIIVLMVSIAVASAAVAQEKMAEGYAPDQSASWQGYLVDAQYADQIAANPTTVMQKASEYPRANATTESSNAEFGIIMKGQWLEFDDNGDKKALALIQTSTRESGFFVTVVGQRQGNTILVTEMQESVEETPPHKPE